MNIGNEIKKIAIDNCVTLTTLAKYISEAKGKDYSVQNLSSKLKKGTINANEIAIICDSLGYELIFCKKQK